MKKILASLFLFSVTACGAQSQTFSKTTAAEAPVVRKGLSDTDLETIAVVLQRCARQQYCTVTLDKEVDPGAKIRKHLQSERSKSYTFAPVRLDAQGVRYAEGDWLKPTRGVLYTVIYYKDDASGFNIHTGVNEMHDLSAIRIEYDQRVAMEQLLQAASAQP